MIMKAYTHACWTVVIGPQLVSVEQPAHAFDDLVTT